MGARGQLETSRAVLAGIKIFNSARPEERARARERERERIIERGHSEYQISEDAKTRLVNYLISY